MNKINYNSLGVSECLPLFFQRKIAVTSNNKILKQGKFLLYKTIHYHLQLVMQTQKSDNDVLELPIPFALEYYTYENLLYFDYRLDSLKIDHQFLNVPPKNSFINKIIEIQVVN